MSTAGPIVDPDGALKCHQMRLLFFDFFLSDLFITSEGKGNVQVKKMECDICKVQTEKGSCLLHSVKVGDGITTNDCCRKVHIKVGIDALTCLHITVSY